MYEVNEDIKASDPLHQQGAHQSSFDLYKQLRSRRPFNEAHMLQPYEWMRVTSTVVMTEAHFKCSSLSAQMAYHLTTDKIRDKKYVSLVGTLCQTSRPPTWSGSGFLNPTDSGFVSSCWTNIVLFIVSRLDCQGNTTRTNIERVNPRPWQRQSIPKTSVHGLLECRSRQCTLEYGHSRKWNRDLMAVCNFRRIWDAHLNNMERPSDLQVQPRNVRDSDVAMGFEDLHGICVLAWDLWY